MDSEAFLKVDQLTFRLLKLLRHLELRVQGSSRDRTAFQNQAMCLNNILSTLTSMPEQNGFFFSRSSLLRSPGFSLADFEGLEFVKLVFLRSQDIALADFEGSAFLKLL